MQTVVDAHFKGQAWLWDVAYRQESLFGVHRQLRQRLALDLVDRLRLPPDARVLEVGCGAGYLTVALARRGFQVDAIDTVGEMLDRARRHADEAGIGGRVAFGPGDAHALNFASGTF